MRLRVDIWIQIGDLHEQMGSSEMALKAYEKALAHYPHSVSALTKYAHICRTLENYDEAIEFFQRVLSLEPGLSDVWEAVAHCYLVTDQLALAYSAYQNAFKCTANKRDPKLWYGIGILYDQFGSYDLAEEAFSTVMQLDAKFDKANEIYFRLSMLYKGQSRFDKSLECLDYVIANPPPPLTKCDLWFQIGHVHELAKDYSRAREAYEKVLAINPDHIKVLQQLGWLYAQPGTSFTDTKQAEELLSRAITKDDKEGQSWYLLGRCNMLTRNHSGAYDCYQQAVFRDSNNAQFWCSIGVLYFQISQYRDALDAYSRALRFNSQLSEVWHNLGTLYETCNNQVDDAINAYSRALEYDSGNEEVKQRLRVLQHAQSTGNSANLASEIPHPQD
ncbi:hypothetical protein BJ085DRAFT_17381, partial [Dimargaris cristalligena]